MIKVYSPGNLVEAQCLKDMLLSRHVPCHLAGVDLIGAMGELPALGLLGLYVETEDAGLARQLIEDYLGAVPVINEDE